MEGWDGLPDEDKSLETAVLALTDTTPEKPVPFPVRTRPTTLHAFPWIPLFDSKITPGGKYDYSELIDGYSQDHRTAYIYELDGRREITEGDYIIVVKGYRYICTAENFTRSYDIV